MILLLDNYDSFTYNLQHYISRTGEECQVVRNDEVDIKTVRGIQPDAIVISPGPGRPEESGITMQVIEAFHQELPILGICLGFQAVGEFFGAKLVHGPEPVHGKTSMMTHKGGPLFEGVPASFEVMRYHSLVIEALPDCLEALGETADGVCMALRHKQLPAYGLQFHPESILTEHGFEILNNWVQLVAKAPQDGLPNRPIVF